ncbi:hypothetical protein [Cryobacterium sp. SO1]|uniref:beta family protein n=1 Tax=Cryobacterium sp. SO1 TaxID=1897061 RepID=UPI001023E209
MLLPPTDRELTHEQPDAEGSRTVGGAGFPDTTGLARGVSEHLREDWTLFQAVFAKRKLAGLSPMDFFDNAIQNPSFIDVGVDPRFLSISALMRYTTSDRWLIAKGELFKGPAGKSRGGAALIPALDLLVAHPSFGDPILTAMDTWVGDVLSGRATPGGPETWRTWGTLRHIESVSHQLATMP